MDDANVTTMGGNGELVFADPAVELASNRTSMSFERTRMGADRTLMAAIRTSLSLISFGFTIFQFFRQLALAHLTRAVTEQGARNFGLALVLLGVGLLIACLFVHDRAISALRQRRDRLYGLNLLRHGPQYRTSPTAVIAALLLMIGIAAVLGMIARAGPFS